MISNWNNNKRMKIDLNTKHTTWVPFDTGEQDVERDQSTNESNQNEEKIQEDVKGE